MNNLSPSRPTDEPRAAQLLHKLSSWLGLAWVYSGGIWLLVLFMALSNGWLEGAAALGLRLVATLAVGIGICAAEQWAWATALCLSALYGASAATLGSVIVHALLTRQPALSWQHVFLGFTQGQSETLALVAFSLTGMALVNLIILWKAQTQFDVPYRRPFTVLARYGFLPTLGMAAIDLFVVSHGGA